MGQEPVGGEVLVDRTEVERVLGGPAGARYARGGIDDDPAGLDQPVPHQGRQGQAGRSRITPRPPRSGWRPRGTAPRGTARAARTQPPPARPEPDGPPRTRPDRRQGHAAGSRPPGSTTTPGTWSPQLGHDPLGSPPWGRAQNTRSRPSRPSSRPARRARPPRRPSGGRRRPTTACARPPAPRRGHGPSPPPPRCRDGPPVGATARPPCSPTLRRSRPSSHQYTYQLHTHAADSWALIGACPDHLDRGPRAPPRGPPEPNADGRTPPMRGMSTRPRRPVAGCSSENVFLTLDA